jgi:hypothetical protein
MKTLLLQAVIMAFGLPQAYEKLTEFSYVINFDTGKNALASYGFHACHYHWVAKDSSRTQQMGAVPPLTVATTFWRKGCNTELELQILPEQR